MRTENTGAHAAPYLPALQHLTGTWPYGVPIPAACINRRNSPATSPSASTLADQINSSQPRRCHSGFFSCWSGMACTSMIAVFLGHLAAKHVVAPGGVHQDEGDNEQRADQDETLALRRCGGLPDAHRRRDDVRPQADAQAAVAEEDQRQGQQERRIVGV